MKKGRRSREKRGGEERKVVAPGTEKRFRRITGHRDPTPGEYWTERQGRRRWTSVTFGWPAQQKTSLPES